MLRKIRIFLAIIVFSCITLLFLDFSGIAHKWLGWIAKIQFIPAILALNIGIIILLILLTLFFGRIYCSIICPLGILQDIFARTSKVFSKKRNRYNYSKAISWLRYLVLGLFIIAFVGGVILTLNGFNPLISLLDPYSSYGRIASNLFQPIWLWGNNLLAYFAELSNSYMFYSIDVWIKGISTLIVAITTFIILFVLAAKNGRTYCNTICPVGTILGFISKHSLFRIVFNKDKCTHCTLCSSNCKASCINHKDSSIDYTRCVACFDCISKCKHGALEYKFAYKNKEAQNDKCNNESTNNGRRSFLTTALIAFTATTIKAQKKKVDGGLAIIKDKVIPDRNNRITPPGSKSAKDFTKHCTACQLCVSECPNQVLRPSTSLQTFMQPELSYEKGYCRPECMRCSQVCPTGAIKLENLAEKCSTQIGHAVWVKKNCVVLTDNVKCGNCSTHCPAGAISMVSYEYNSKTVKVPAINTERCIGCGACENLCPARPFTAIYVEGNTVHSTI